MAISTNHPPTILVSRIQTLHVCFCHDCALNADTPTFQWVKSGVTHYSKSHLKSHSPHIDVARVTHRCIISEVTMPKSVTYALMFFANSSGNYHPIVMRLGKHYSLVLRRLPRKIQEKILCSLKAVTFHIYSKLLIMTLLYKPIFHAVMLAKSACKISWKLIGNWLRNQRKHSTPVAADIHYRSCNLVCSMHAVCCSLFS